jgi:hypothetical protein
LFAFRAFWLRDQWPEAVLRDALSYAEMSGAGLTFGDIFDGDFDLLAGFACKLGKICKLLGQNL